MTAATYANRNPQLGLSATVSAIAMASITVVRTIGRQRVRSSHHVSTSHT